MEEEDVELELEEDSSIWELEESESPPQEAKPKAPVRRQSNIVCFFMLAYSFQNIRVVSLAFLIFQGKLYRIKQIFLDDIEEITTFYAKR